MHAKLVLIDGREAFLLGSPFVNSYWDDGAHLPYDARRPLRELGGRPLHDVSVHLRGPAVAELEALFASVWRCERSIGARSANVAAPSRYAARRCSARGDARGVRCARRHSARCAWRWKAHARRAAGGDRARALASSTSSISISLRGPSSPHSLARSAASPASRSSSFSTRIPDLTAYRAWQNDRLEEHALLQTSARRSLYALEHGRGSGTRGRHAHQPALHPQQGHRRR